MIYNQKLFDKYLNLLGVQPDSPSIEMLGRVVKSHLIKIPFENISKLLYKKRGMNNIPDLQTFLEGIEKYNFGGTCYTNNYYLYLLLQHLGYEIKLCGADMKTPDVHLISIVTIENKEFIVDCGYAAPFFEPIPRDLTKDFVIDFGSEKYVVKPKDKNGRTKVEQHSISNLQHWYVAKPEPRKIDEFKKVIESSYSDDAVFMNALRITKFTEEGSVVLRNLQLTETIGSEVSVKEISLINIAEVVEVRSGIPAEKVREAAATVKKLKDIFD